MKTITIDIAEGGEVICNDTNLGRAGEHNNTKFHIIIADNALSECDYFRCWFGNKYSTDLIADNSQIMYMVPQDALLPPTVDFQLCGYKANNGVPYVIARSSVITFTVEESACCSLISDQAFEPFEVMTHDCENAAKAAKESEISAENSAAHARQFCQETMEVYDKIPDFEQIIANKADVVFGRKGQYMGFANDDEAASVMTPDTVPNENSKKLITSGGVYQAIKDRTSYDYVYTNFTNKDDFLTEMSKKQEKLNGYEGQYVGFEGIVGSEPVVLLADWEPTQESDRLITSGGVYNATKNKVDKEFVEENYISKNEFNNTLNNEYYTKSIIDTEFENMSHEIQGVAIEEIQNHDVIIQKQFDTKVDRAELENYVTHQELVNERNFILGTAALKEDLDGKVDKTYVDEQIGDIETVLDSIIALQNSLIGGDGE